ncbi:MAG: hypothetical protein ABIJ43_03155 [Candidatus Beckwithbacteria bacterium]|nr:hypothetical protein [Patescibacteria group bacterium]
MYIFKYPFIFFTYLWLRFDPIIYLTFRKDWAPRYEFMASIFGEKNINRFFKYRIQLVKARNKILSPIISPKHAENKIQEFITINVNTKIGKIQRIDIINELIFWATDEEINRQNIDSYKTRITIIEALLGVIFKNTIGEETDIILKGLEKIVFSRTTYLGSKGEPSPVVHDAIITNVGHILTSHFNEVTRLRDEKLDTLTKVQLIKEINESSNGKGSMAFSAGITKKNDEYKHKYPLENNHANLLIKILKHYCFSAWPDSRERAINLIKTMEKQLGFAFAS